MMVIKAVSIVMVIVDIMRYLKQQELLALVDGAYASTNLFSLIESAKLHNLGPVKYLTHVFKELPNCKTIANDEALLPYAICDEKLKISR